jgi:hypothetical protein
MGEQGAASASEFRTTPLWGLRRRVFLLHDGRVFGKPFAGLMDDAVAWHGTPGSEAAPAAQAWAALAPEERAQVVAFLGSLGRREFDHDGNDKVNGADLVAFRRCTEVGGPITPDSPCAVFDLDADGDLDLYDYAGMLEVLE